MAATVVLLLLAALGLFVFKKESAAALSLLKASIERFERVVADASDRDRHSMQAESATQRRELGESIRAAGDSIGQRVAELGNLQGLQLDRFGNALESSRQGVESRLDVVSGAVNSTLGSIQAAHVEMHTRLGSFATVVTGSVEAAGTRIDQNLSRFESQMQSVLADTRDSSAASATALRQEIRESLTALGGSLGSSLDVTARRVDERLATSAVSAGLELQRIRETFASQAEQSRNSLERRFEAASSSQAAGLRALIEQTNGNFTALSTLVSGHLDRIEQSNLTKLEEMRRTVDEKLEGTLERRLGESFSKVSERLEQVHKGLGEMQGLATGVGDLKRVLTSVKARGTWGEVRLKELLDHVLTPDQYGVNVAVRPHSSSRVEFAIRLPGHEDTPVWLPIDSKFPLEDYERLQEAAERGDSAGVEASAKALEHRVKACAKDISEKYICAPHTTDFALMFLPTEGLYAEVLRRPGLIDSLQREMRVVVAGPTTLLAQLNSIQMGFRTVAISKRSEEVWRVLGGVKAEFETFGTVLAKVKDQLERASDTIGKAETRSRQIQRKLKDVEALPAPSDDVVVPEEVLA